MLFIIVMVIKVNLYLLDISNIVQLRVVKYQFRVWRGLELKTSSGLSYLERQKPYAYDWAS